MNRARELFDTYTHDLSREDLQRLFTHDTPDAYGFFPRGVADAQWAGLPPWKRLHRVVQMRRGEKVPAQRRPARVVADSQATASGRRPTYNSHADPRAAASAGRSHAVERMRAPPGRRSNPPVHATSNA
ncbi:MAG: hypothetical protein M3545_05800 [Acidobacteriota bacterium]|nr:hypothetical protein [Acidobacteriota bacterium]